VDGALVPRGEPGNERQEGRNEKEYVEQVPELDEQFLAQELFSLGRQVVGAACLLLPGRFPRGEAFGTGSQPGIGCLDSALGVCPAAGTVLFAGLHPKVMAPHIFIIGEGVVLPSIWGRRENHRFNLFLTIRGCLDSGGCQDATLLLVM